MEITSKVIYVNRICLVSLITHYTNILLGMFMMSRCTRKPFSQLLFQKYNNMQHIIEIEIPYFRNK